MLDLALLAANATQLKHILGQWDGSVSQTFVFYMVIASIALQVNSVSAEFASYNKHE